MTSDLDPELLEPAPDPTPPRHRGDEPVWHYDLTLREAAIVEAALRAYADRPGRSDVIADRIAQHRLCHHNLLLGPGPWPR